MRPRRGPRRGCRLAAIRFRAPFHDGHAHLVGNPRLRIRRPEMGQPLPDLQHIWRRSFPTVALLAQVVFDSSPDAVALVAAAGPDLDTGRFPIIAVADRWTK